MLLIGMFDSPFVRRVAVSLRMLDLAFEHANWSVGRDGERIRQYNPLGRVPALVLDEGEVLVDSTAILDYLDEQVGPRRALLPSASRERREALRLVTMALGAAEKGRDQLYELIFRPPEKRYEPWLARCRLQMQAALAELDGHCERRGSGRWLLGPALTQVDITAVCAFTYLAEGLPLERLPTRYPSLAALVGRSEALTQFRDSYAPFAPPSF